jgi:hypothetical protein
LKTGMGSCRGLRGGNDLRSQPLKLFRSDFAFIAILVFPKLSCARPVTTHHWRGFGMPLSGEERKLARPAMPVRL